MARKRFTAEQMIRKLREAEVGLARGTNGAAGMQTDWRSPESSLSGRTL